MTQSTQPIGLQPVQPPASPGRPAPKAEPPAWAKPLRLEVALGTHPGVARDYNEDAISGTPLDFPAAVQRGYLFIVADGMGGHNAGEVASTESVRRMFERYYEDGDAEIHRSLENAMRRTNAELFNQAQNNPQQRGMGTTLTAAVVKENRLYVAHVGDSRLYLIRNGQPEQVTQDHSWVEEQVRAGVLTRLQAESHPQRNVITRALATTPDVKVEHYERELQPGDTLVLCSDGLNTEVGDAQIAAHATKAASAEEAVRRLIQLANDNGGEDNISAIVIRLSDGAAAAGAALPAAGTAAAKGGRKFPLLPVAAGAAALVLVAALGVLAVPRLFPRPGGTPVVVSPHSTTAASVTAVPSATLAETSRTPPGVAAVGTTAVIATPPGGSPSETAAAAERTSSIAPTVTLIPSPMPETPTATRKPSGSRTPAATATPKTGAVPPHLLTPQDKEAGGGNVTFLWKEGGALPAGALYEVVVWDKDEVPTLYGPRGIAAPTGELFVRVNLDTCWEKSLFTTPEFNWTVLVVHPGAVGVAGGYERLTSPSESEPRRFTYRAPEPTSEPSPLTPAPP